MERGDILRRREGERFERVGVDISGWLVSALSCYGRFWELVGVRHW